MIRRKIYREEQRLPKFVWLLVVPLTAVVAAVGYAIFQQSVSRQQLDPRPLSDGGVLLAGLVVFTLWWFSIYVLWRLRLIVEVDQECVTVQLIPLLGFRAVRLDNIIEFTPRFYRPILDYGGWGFRLGLKGWVYSVSGNQGVYLKLRHGWPLMIGSQSPEELAAAIARAKAVNSEG